MPFFLFYLTFELFAPKPTKLASTHSANLGQLQRLSLEPMTSVIPLGLLSGTGGDRLSPSWSTTIPNEEVQSPFKSCKDNYNQEFEDEMLHVKQGLSPRVHLVQDSSMEAIHVIPIFNVEKKDDHHPKPTTQMSNINGMVHMVFLLIIIPF